MINLGAITEEEFEKGIFKLRNFKRISLERKKEYERIFRESFLNGRMLKDILKETFIKRRSIQHMTKTIFYKPFSSFKVCFITRKLNQGYPIKYISSILGHSERYNENTIIRRHYMGFLPPRKKLRVLKRDNFRCKFCGKTANDTQLHIDHITPLSKGGSNNLENLQVLCAECNQAKSNKTEFAYVK